MAADARLTACKRDCLVDRLVIKGYTSLDHMVAGLRQINTLRPPVHFRRSSKQDDPRKQD